MAIYATHIGSYFYMVESSYGAGFAAGQQEIPSDSVTSATMTPSMNVKRLPTINDYDYQDTTIGAHDYTVNVEYAFQQIKAATSHLATTCLEYLTVNRTAGDIASIASCLKTGPASWLVLKGGKINTQTITFAVGEPVAVATELWSNNLTTSATTPTGTVAPAIAEAFDTFNGSLFTRTGKWVAGIKGATLTINNNLERIPRINTGTAQGGDYSYIMPGIQETTITADIIADTGGKADIDDILTDPETTIILQTGTTAGKSCKWTLTKPTFNSEPVVYTADLTTLIISASMGSESLAFAVV